MPTPVPLIAASEIPPGEGREVVAAGRIFAVFNVEGTFEVLDGICPHAGGPLGKGTLNGGTVTCPWHGWQFDVTSGQHCLNDTLCQQHFPAEVRDGQVTVLLEETPPAS
ncbi:MAG: Rieske 2Fe-2S domain-containing protein [Planctomycetaceae bacterium]|nr:Rieske 2Fe-2S domain-containing protein [Planctomycetaceae bacterium]